MSVNFGFSLPALRQYGAAGSNPFGQLGPTLDLSFVDGATGVTDLSNPTGYTLNTNFIAPEYQVAAQYAVWGANGLTQQNFADIVTFTRASTASYFNSTGTLQSAAIDAPRFDYNPSTLAAQGLLIEESRTNSIRNNTMQGAAAGTPGTLPTNWTSQLSGLTQTIVGTGTSNGIAYVDIRLNGTTSNTFFNINVEGQTNIAATNAQAWTGSVWLSVVGGSTTNITSIAWSLNQYSSVPVYLSTLSGTNRVSTISSTLTRITDTYTTNNASIAFVQPVLAMLCGLGVAIDITFRIGLPQLEQGAFATSVIPTTTTALTRSADVASVNTLSPWYNASAGTLFSESVLARQNAMPNVQTANIRNAGITNEIRLFYRSSGGTGQAVIDATIAQADLSATGVITANATLKMALAYSANDFAASGNGGAVVTDTSGTVPSGLTEMSLGANGLNGYLRRITYYPRRLSNADLQTITT